MTGAVLDKYEVLQKVGEGGMATVYRGRHVTLGREVAIKVLHPHLSASSRNRQRFAREARAIEQLDHENILKIFDYSGTEVEDCFIVTEFVHGRTLQELLRTRGLFPSEVAARIAREIAEALRYAHGAGIVHRDIKPENVMLRYDGTIKLMDFGIARFLDESSVTMTGALVGSPAYMSPEQALERPVDQRSDLFSLGTMIYHMVAGMLPFSGSNPSVILRNIIEGSRPVLLEAQPGVAPRLADLVERLLQVDVDARPRDAAAVCAALDEVLAQSELPLDQPAWSLRAWLDDFDGWEFRLKQHLQPVLLRRARAAFEQGDPLCAQRLLNRLLVFQPDHPEVPALLSSLHQPEAPSRSPRRWQLPAAAALLVLLGGSAWALLGPSGQVAATPTAPAPTATAAVSAPLQADPQPLEVSSPPTPAPAAAPEPEPPPPRLRDPSPPPEALGPSIATPPRASTRPTAASGAGTAAPAATARVTVRLSEPGWAEVHLDGKPQGRVRQPLELMVPPGPHKLTLTNPFAREYTTSFNIAEGESRDFDITLIQKPLRVSFDEELDPECVATVDGRSLGGIGALGRAFELADPDTPHLVTLACPDGQQLSWPIEGRVAGSRVVLPP